MAFDCSAILLQVTAAGAIYDEWSSAAGFLPLAVSSGMATVVSLDAAAILPEVAIYADNSGFSTVGVFPLVYASGSTPVSMTWGSVAELLGVEAAGSSDAGARWDCAPSLLRMKVSGKTLAPMLFAAGIEFPPIRADAMFSVQGGFDGQTLIGLVLAEGTLLTPAVADVFNSFIMNTKTAGVAQYLNFPFTSIFKHPLGYFGISADGLFQLNGKNDDGANIDVEILTGVATLGTDRRKVFPEAYLEMRGGEVEFSTIFNEDLDNEIVYDHDFSDNDRLKMHRITLAKGVDGTHVQVRLRNVDGADFDLQSIIIPYLIKKRITGAR